MKTLILAILISSSVLSNDDILEIQPPHKILPNGELYLETHCSNGKIVETMVVYLNSGGYFTLEQVTNKLCYEVEV